MGVGYAPSHMDLSLEAYRTVVKYVGNRSDIASLCRVSKSFRHAAERALYNTLYMRKAHETTVLCHTLVAQPRLSSLVEALTIVSAAEGQSRASVVQDEGDSDDDSRHEHDYNVEEEKCPNTDWNSISHVLKRTINLRYLNIHINDGPASSAWILDGCTFLLRKLHCDFDWDQHLVKFLDKQTELEDLYILDFQDAVASEVMADSPLRSTSVPPGLGALEAKGIPNLSKLECTFIEAVVTILPYRPVTHLKTCFSCSEIIAKRAEMRLLLSCVALSTGPLRSLDIADATYHKSFSMELLENIVNLHVELRYLGTLVLPIGGQERLRFYGLLMRLPDTQCIEVEVSEWDPPPSTPPAFRALANEVRLYCPSITCVVFVHDFDRTVVTAVDGICQLGGDAENLWREV